MNTISKGFRKMVFYFQTAIDRMRWSELQVDGLFRRRCDTQIIITENGKMRIGKNVLFQRCGGDIMHRRPSCI